MRNHRNGSSLLGGAGRGAVAGLLGGAAMAAAERIVLPRLPDRRRPRVVRWDRNVERIAERLGWEISPRTRTIVGITSHLAIATALGALYGVAERRLRPSKAGRQMLEAMLTLGFSLLAPELPARKVRNRGRMSSRLGQRALGPVTSPVAYSRAAAAAFKALTR